MKILIIQQKMIGDVLTSSILFEAIRKKYPHARLDYLIQPHTQAVVENNPYIDNFILFDPQQVKSFSSFFKFAKGIRKMKYDVVIDVYSKINSALITALSGAEKRISYHKWYTSFAYTRTFDLKKEMETNAGFAIENRMLLLQALSKDFPVQLKPKIYLSSEEVERARKRMEKEGISFSKPVVMIGALGSSIKKTYPFPFMAKILDFISEGSPAHMLLNYIPDQRDQVMEIYRLCHPRTQSRIHLDLYGNNLREFMAITSHCDALIGNEGGAVNMAKAMEVPTFSIFSPQIKKENWSIYEDGNQQVSVHLADFDPASIRGVSKKTIVKNHDRFYALLEPSLIFASLKGFLKRNLKTSSKKN